MAALLERDSVLRTRSCQRNLSTAHRPPQNLPRNIRPAHHQHHVLAKFRVPREQRRRTSRPRRLRQDMLLHKQNLNRPQHRLLANQNQIIDKPLHIVHVPLIRRPRSQPIRDRVTSLRAHHAIFFPRAVISRRPLRLHANNLHARCNLFHRRRHPANQSRIPHRHDDRVGRGQLLENFATNCPRPRRQIPIGSVIQKIDSRPLRVLIRQDKRRRQIRPATLHNLRLQRSNPPALHRIAPRRQKNPRLNSKQFRRPSHRRPMIPRTRSNDILHAAALQPRSQPPQRPPHLERPGWQLRLQLQPNPLPRPPAQKRRLNQPRHRKMLRKKLPRLPNRGYLRPNLQGFLAEPLKNYSAIAFLVSGDAPIWRSSSQGGGAAELLSALLPKIRYQRPILRAGSRVACAYFGR